MQFKRYGAIPAFKKAFSWGYAGNSLGLPFVGLAAATAQRGEVIPTAIGSGVSFGTIPFAQGMFASCLGLIPGLGPGAIIFASMIAAGLVATTIENGVSRTVRQFSKVGLRVRRLEYGQGFQDDMSSYQLRMQGIQEMSSSVTASRRFLGREAMFLHR